jgi:hypothetical protein
MGKQSQPKPKAAKTKATPKRSACPKPFVSAGKDGSCRKGFIKYDRDTFVLPDGTPLSGCMGCCGSIKLLKATKIHVADTPAETKAVKEGMNKEEKKELDAEVKEAKAHLNEYVKTEKPTVAEAKVAASLQAGLGQAMHASKAEAFNEIVAEAKAAEATAASTPAAAETWGGTFKRWGTAALSAGWSAAKQFGRWAAHGVQWVYAHREEIMKKLDELFDFIIAHPEMVELLLKVVGGIKNTVCNYLSRWFGEQKIEFEPPATWSGSVYNWVASTMDSIASLAGSLFTIGRKAVEAAIANMDPAKIVGGISFLVSQSGWFTGGIGFAVGGAIGLASQAFASSVFPKFQTYLRGKLLIETANQFLEVILGECIHDNIVKVPGLPPAADKELIKEAAAKNEEAGWFTRWMGAALVAKYRRAHKHKMLTQKFSRGSRRSRRR